MLTMTKTRRPARPNDQVHSVSRMTLFKNIPPAGLLEIEKNMVEEQYAKKESIFVEKENAESVWFVKKGQVKEIHFSPDGHSNTICIVGANGMFGVSAFNGQEYGFHCVAETNATVISFRIEFFNELVGKYPQIARDALSKISMLLSRSKDMQIFFQESAEKRIFDVLMKMVGGVAKIIPLTRKEIGEMEGTTVSDCIRTCVRLEKAGLITSAYSHITAQKTDDSEDRIGGEA